MERRMALKDCTLITAPAGAALLHEIYVEGAQPDHTAGQQDRSTSERLANASEFRTYLPLQVLLIALTFITGILDATTYLGFGNVFAANMTGNFVLLAVGVLRGGDVSMSASVFAVTGFLAGVAAGGRLAQLLKFHGQRCLVTTLIIVGGLLWLAVLAAANRGRLGDYPTLVALACAMGLTNATASLIGSEGLTTTTVITSTLTSLISYTQLPHGDTRKRLRQIAAVAALVSGAVVGGAVALQFGATIAIGMGAAGELAAAAAYVTALRRKRRSFSAGPLHHET
jgi:uncharacterized membrane protein YoaK (UPF0700 family)